MGFENGLLLNFASDMKRTAIIISYWCLMVLLTAIMLSSLSYSFSESCLLASLLLPGGIVIKFMLPRILAEPAKTRVRKILLLLLTALVIDVLLVFIGHGILLNIRHELYRMGGEFPGTQIPDIMVNPVFLTLLLLVFSGGDYLLERFLEEHLRQKPQSITFTSDRKPVTLLQSDILFVESNDTEVWIHSLDGQKYRNKTAISQWENMLGMDFVRIHRSYLVNRPQISQNDSETVTLSDGQVLPVSRKYRERIPTT